MLKFKNIAKKTWKKIGALTLAGAIAVTGICGGTVVQAADGDTCVSWSAYKSPGVSGSPSTYCTLTLYGGDIQFYTYTLGDASYVAAKCVGDNCTINNSDGYVIRSVTSKTSATHFRVTGCKGERMQFKITLLHNGGKDNTIHGTGKICY